MKLPNFVNPSADSYPKIEVIKKQVLIKNVPPKLSPVFLLISNLINKLINKITNKQKDRALVFFIKKNIQKDQNHS